jgi:CubicO group peptidase (beta-lactamase class C family)
MSRRELLTAAAGIAAGPLPGAADRWAAVNAFVEEGLHAGVYPGAALIVSHKGRIVFQRSWGTYCSLTDRAAPLSLSVRHPLYSYSKLISATVVVMAHQDGRIAYDAPVRTYIPEFVGGGKESITLRQLLTHSAGIPNVPLGPVRTEEEWRAAVRAVCEAQIEWPPGSKTLYHGLSGLFVAAEAVRRVTGNPSWERLCRERLFDPIGAKTLTFAVPPDSAPVALTPQPKELPKTLFDGLGLGGHPAGGCIGTIADALKVLQLHLNGGVWRGRRLLRADALAEMHTVQYARQIAQARASGQTPAHETWGLGPLLRGDGPATGSHDWFGFHNQNSPGIFGHAGIDTVIGVADPASQIGLFFVTTDSPRPPEKTVQVRNGVTDRVFAALAGAG